MVTYSTTTVVNRDVKSLVHLVERLVYLIVWVVYVFLFLVDSITSKQPFINLVAFFIEGLLFDFIIIYSFSVYFFPKLWKPGKKIWFWAATFCIIGLYPVLKMVADDLIKTFIPQSLSPADTFFNGFYRPERAMNAPVVVPDSVHYILRLCKVIAVVIVAALFYAAINWFKRDKLRSQLESQNLSSELSWLRSQINPHFLFNTLNNIYYLVYSKSDNATEAVLKLSAIMRYMLYESDAPKVPLEKEVNYLKDFISLQQMRIKHKEMIRLEVVGNVHNKLIAPMLLIPFLENAFKHGDLGENSYGVTIRLETGPGRLSFEVINGYKEVSSNGKDKVGGIGLTNIQRRLALIYPDAHDLTISKTDNIYKVNLIIEE